MHGIGVQLAPFAPTRTSVKLARVDEGVGVGMDEWLGKCYLRESAIRRFSSLERPLSFFPLRGTPLLVSHVFFPSMADISSSKERVGFALFCRAMQRFWAVDEDPSLYSDM